LGTAVLHYQYMYQYTMHASTYHTTVKPLSIISRGTAEKKKR